MNDSRTTIKELRDRVTALVNARDWSQFHTAKDLAIGISTEAAELLEIFRFKSPQECEDLFKDEKKLAAIKDELADVLYFLMRFSEMYKIDLSTVFVDKLVKIEQKYPIEKFKGSNKKYNEE